MAQQRESERPGRDQGQAPGARPAERGQPPKEREPREREEDRRDRLDDEKVDEASEESFPASDAPGWSPAIPG